VVWALFGQKISPGKRVLQTGSIKVDQFYSGLVLSIALAPAGILIRRISSDLGLFHPFAIASQASVPLADLDRMMNPGMGAARTTLLYSWWHFVVQLYLLTVGAILVPTGTLLVTTGDYTPNTNGTAVVGMPTFLPYSPGDGGYGASRMMSDDLMPVLLDEFKGRFIAQAGFLSAIEPPLGPPSTVNLTYEEGVRYDGIVTYNWDAGCNATDDIKFEIFPDPNWGEIVRFTFPDGSKKDDTEGSVFLWANLSNPPNLSTSSMQLGTTYFAIVSLVDNDEPDTLITSFRDSFAMTRVKCLPSMSWEVSSCYWRSESMVDCKPAPDRATIDLDRYALNFTNWLFTALPSALYSSNESLWNQNNGWLNTIFTIDPLDPSAIEQSIPILEDFENFYGLIAQSIAFMALTGKYGTATVLTVGQSPRPVYIVRVYILGLLVGMLVIASSLVAIDVLYHWFRHLPWRKTSFLTIACAVRGQWWDQTLDGYGTVSLKELRKKLNMKVMYGFDRDDEGSIVLRPEVIPIHRPGISFRRGREADEALQ
jgi:hypothetical protein